MALGLDLVKCVGLSPSTLPPPDCSVVTECLEEQSEHVGVTEAAAGAICGTTKLAETLGP